MHVFLDIRTFGLTPLSNKYPDINPLWDVITIPATQWIFYTPISGAICCDATDFAYSPPVMPFSWMIFFHRAESATMRLRNTSGVLTTGTIP